MCEDVVKELRLLVDIVCCFEQSYSNNLSKNKKLTRWCWLLNLLLWTCSFDIEAALWFGNQEIRRWWVVVFLEFCESCWTVYADDIRRSLKNKVHRWEENRFIFANKFEETWQFIVWCCWNDPTEQKNCWMKILVFSEWKFAHWRHCAKEIKKMVCNFVLILYIEQKNAFSFC